VAIDLVLVVKVPPIRLGGLIHGMFDLYRDTPACLCLLDNLGEEREEKYVSLN